MSLKVCAADDCVETFEPDPLSGKRYCSYQCATRMRVRRKRARDRNGKGGGGGNGGGGGALIESFSTVDPAATYVPDIRYRTPRVEHRKPSTRVRSQTSEVKHAA